MLVKNTYDKWGMCVNYTILNQASPKDLYPLPNINKLMDSSAEYKLLSFMDAYSDYNQILMYKPDREKITFMIEQANYQYNTMPFILENSRTSYQRMMNKVFNEKIGETMYTYMDGMIIKSNKEKLHDKHLTSFPKDMTV